MEKLLDQADALLLTAVNDDSGDYGQQQLMSSSYKPTSRPNFDIPIELAQYADPQQYIANLLELRNVDSTTTNNNNDCKNKGWFAKQSIAAGTILMISKPITWIMDCEAEDDEEDDEGEAPMMEDDEDDNEDEEDEDTYNINDSLILEVLETIKENPNIWLEQITNLYPRKLEQIGEVDDGESSSLLLPPWDCTNPKTLAKFNTLIAEIEQSVPQLKGISSEISKRLPLIIRYNVLSVETCPELLSYPGTSNGSSSKPKPGYSILSGVGLYYLPSFFNHTSCGKTPNVSRYAVGDIMWFVTNQPVQQSEEVCISYLEHDILCEPPKRKNEMLFHLFF